MAEGSRTKAAPVKPKPGAARVVAPSRSRGSGCADLLTALFLILTIGVIAFTILLYANPSSVLNPFPPPATLSILVIATDIPTNTPTKTPTPLPASPTPIASITPSPTPTVPTKTPTPSYTPVVAVNITISPAPSVRSTARPAFTQSAFPFTVNPIRYVANTTKEACNWQSIVITALDLDSKPVKNILAHVVGAPSIDEFDPLNQHSQIGDNTFEVLLGAVPQANEYTVQLVSRTGSPISDIVNVQTKTACNENVAVVTFAQNHPY